jgi:hypothetical protein
MRMGNRIGVGVPLLLQPGRDGVTCDGVVHKKNDGGAAMRVKALLATALVLGFGSSVTQAGEADVIDVESKEMSNRLFHFTVTVVHADEGWDHYVDRWDVVAPDGTVLGTRSLYQPNENGQQFTSSLVGVKVPDGISEVTLRAHDTVHEYGGKSLVATLQR